MVSTSALAALAAPGAGGACPPAGAPIAPDTWSGHRRTNTGLTAVSR